MSMKIVSMVGGAFIVGAIFWAGATYNRISGIEQQLVEIKSALPSMSRIAILEERINIQQRDIDTLRSQLNRRGQ